MNRTKYVISLLLIGMMIFSYVGQVQADPPDPNNFGGDILFMEGDDVPTTSDFVAIYIVVSELEQLIISTAILDASPPLYYSVNVPGDDPDTTGVVEGAIDGQFLIFKINDRVVAAGNEINGIAWHSYSSTILNLHPPKANAGGPYEGVVGVAVNLTGSATDRLSTDEFTYSWDLDDDGEFDDSTDQNPTSIFYTAGTHYVHLKVTDKQGGEGTATTSVEISEATATVTLSNLTQTYDGEPKPVTVETVPVGLTVNVTYDLSTTPPTNAGSYAVVATVVDDNYQGSASGTLVINKATATVNLSNLAQTYDGSQKTVTVETVPVGLTVNVTYDLATTPPTNAGSYAVVATVVDDNYEGSASDTLVINKATATISIKAADLEQIYGSIKAVTATTTPSGVSYSVTYDDNTTLPTTTGDFTVVATITDPNYETSSDTKTLMIRATQTIQLQSGWNLVSFSLIPSDYIPDLPTGNDPVADTSVTSLFSGLYNEATPLFDIVYAWDAALDAYIKYDPAYDITNLLNTLTNMENTMGFWIKMATEEGQVTTLTIQGNFPTTNTNINLDSAGTGWNLVSYPSTNITKYVPEALNGIPYSLVFSYRAGDSDPWKLFDLNAPTYVNDLGIVTQGWGYWIKVIEAATWTVPY